MINGRVGPAGGSSPHLCWVRPLPSRPDATGSLSSIRMGKTWATSDVARTAQRGWPRADSGGGRHGSTAECLGPWRELWR